MAATIRFEGFEAGPIADGFRRVYDALSTNPLPASIAGIPRGMEPLLHLIYKGWVPQLSALYDLPRYGPVNPAKAMVCFSGGKDSAAAALRLQREGREVILVHVPGVNRHATGEEEEAYLAKADKILYAVAVTMLNCALRPNEVYSLRHTCLTRMAEYTPLPTLQVIAGHYSITMTMRYAHPQAESVEAAFAKRDQRVKTRYTRKIRLVTEDGK